MASTFTVEYTQGATGPGQITFTVDASSQTVTATGRLDAVGNRVVASLSAPVGGSVDVTIECIRTSSHTMRVVVIFEPLEYGVITAERVIENVPITFQ
jgi:hypothetical protein